MSSLSALSRKTKDTLCFEDLQHSLDKPSITAHDARMDNQIAFPLLPTPLDSSAHVLCCTVRRYSCDQIVVARVDRIT